MAFRTLPRDGEYCTPLRQKKPDMEYKNAVPRLPKYLQRPINRVVTNERYLHPLF